METAVLTYLPQVNPATLFDLAASAVLILLLLLVRILAIRFIRRKTALAPNLQRRWITSIRYVLFFLLLVGLVLIWAPQLRTFALSLTAVAVALVVATKELILCFTGSFMRASSRFFSVGDWIEVNGIRGEVVDHNLFVTTLQELDGGPHAFHYSGRTAVVANSAFFANPVRNLSFLKDHLFYSFAITVDPAVDIFAHRARIRDIVERHYAPLRPQAAHVNAQIERRAGVDLLDPEVRIRFSTTDLGKYRITITLFCPSARAEELETEIVCDLMAELRAHTPDSARAPA